jgi:hypothetical protein
MAAVSQTRIQTRTRGEQRRHRLHARIERRLTELAFQRAQLIGNRRARVVEHAAAAIAGALTPAAARPLDSVAATVCLRTIRGRTVHSGLRHLLEVGLEFGNLGAQTMQTLKRRFKERAPRAERGRQRGKFGLLRGQLAIELRTRLIGGGRF